jgi:hypothetical protein
MEPGRDEHGGWLRLATPEELDTLTDGEIAAAIATDPGLVARAARHAQEPEYLASGPARAA